MGAFFVLKSKKIGDLAIIFGVLRLGLAFLIWRFGDCIFRLAFWYFIVIN